VLLLPAAVVTVAAGEPTLSVLLLSLFVCFVAVAVAVVVAVVVDVVVVDVV